MKIQRRRVHLATFLATSGLLGWMTNGQDEAARVRTKRCPLGQIIERLLSGNCFLIASVGDSLRNVSNTRRDSCRQTSRDGRN